jgi:predicted nucleic acid-binding protein
VKKSGRKSSTFRVRVLLDSNVWLAILTTDGQYRRMWRQVRDVSQVFASADILGEIEEKLRLKFGFHPRHAHLLAAFVRRQTKSVTVK